VVPTAADVYDLTPAPELLHGEESVVYADAGYQGIDKRSEMEGRGIEKTNPHTKAKRNNQFRLIKRQFGFQKTIMRGMLGVHCKVNVLTTCSNLFMMQHELQCRS
jgi:IS5 family transposase